MPILRSGGGSGYVQKNLSAALRMGDGFLNASGLLHQPARRYGRVRGAHGVPVLLPSAATPIIPIRQLASRDGLLRIRVGEIFNEHLGTRTAGSALAGLFLYNPCRTIGLHVHR